MCKLVNSASLHFPLLVYNPDQSFLSSLVSTQYKLLGKPMGLPLGITFFPWTSKQQADKLFGFSVLPLVCQDPDNCRGLEACRDFCCVTASGEY
jgi:hypothetical protein